MLSLLLLVLLFYPLLQWIIPITTFLRRFFAGPLPASVVPNYGVLGERAAAAF